MEQLYSLASVQVISFAASKEYLVPKKIKTMFWLRWFVGSKKIYNFIIQNVVTFKSPREAKGITQRHTAI